MDVQLHFEERGKGAPLILLHGNGESGAYFTSQIETLGRRFRVIAPDTRGHGESPRGTAPFTLDQFAEDLADFMEERGVERAHILGFSDGGNIALLFALRHPERVEKLVLNGANLDPRGVKASVQIPIALGYGLASLFARLDHKAIAHKEMLGLMVTQPHIRPSVLSALTTPTLVIAGTRDMIRSEHTRLIARSIPGARLCFLEGDHFIAAKNSQAFNAAVLAFLLDGGNEEKSR